MDAIKKKMQAMKIEKENALDKSEQLDQKLRDVEEAKAKVCSFFLVFTRLSCVIRPFLFRKVIPKSVGFSATKIVKFCLGNASLAVCFSLQIHCHRCCYGVIEVKDQQKYVMNGL